MSNIVLFNGHIRAIDFGFICGMPRMQELPWEFEAQDYETGYSIALRLTAWGYMTDFTEQDARHLESFLEHNEELLLSDAIRFKQCTPWVCRALERGAAHGSLRAPRILRVLSH